MSLNIKDAVYGLGVKLGVDMSHAPASNIADTIDYISNGVGAHTGVIAEAVDKMDVGGDAPDWMFVVDAAPIETGSSTFKLNKTYAEIKQIIGSYQVGVKIVGIIRMLFEEPEGVFYSYITNVGYNYQSEQYDVETNTPGLTFTTGSEDGYPTVTE